MCTYVSLIQESLSLRPPHLPPLKKKIITSFFYSKNKKTTEILSHRQKCRNMFKRHLDLLMYISIYMYVYIYMILPPIEYVQKRNKEFIQ